MSAGFYEEGGWGMYPTSLFGFLLVAAGVVYLLRPERRFLPLVLWLSAVTFGAGFLGFCTGLVSTAKYLQKVSPEEVLKIAALGFAESLNNVILALMFLVLTGLLASTGAFRAARATTVASSAR